jgi:transposase
MTKNCPCCSGPGVLLGTLALTRHYRCLDCGWTYHGNVRHRPTVRKATPEEAARFLALGTRLPDGTYSLARS